MTDANVIGQGFVPIETRGRKAGARDRAFAGKRAAIEKGVAIAATGKSFVEAADAISGEYPKRISSKHLAKLISNASKSAN